MLVGSAGQTDPGFTWSVVEEGFYVCSRGGNFLGCVDHRPDDTFQVSDGYARRAGIFPDLKSAMAAVVATSGPL